MVFLRKNYFIKKHQPYRKIEEFTMEKFFKLRNSIDSEGVFIDFLKNFIDKKRIVGEFVQKTRKNQKEFLLVFM